jgi:hypothetical protein
MKKLFLFSVLNLVFVGIMFSQQYVTVSGSTDCGAGPSYYNGNYILQGTQINGRNWYDKGNGYILRYNTMYSEWELTLIDHIANDANAYGGSAYYIASTSTTIPQSGWSNVCNGLIPGFSVSAL